MPAGIEFACPHCQRVTKVPVTLAGKQGRCAGCRKVLEVPSGVPTPGRTPDPDEGLLEVLEARRASERLRRPSDRVPGLEPARPSQRVPRRSGQGRVPAADDPDAPDDAPDDAPGDDVPRRSGRGRVRAADDPDDPDVPPRRSDQGRVQPASDPVRLDEPGPDEDDDPGSTTGLAAPPPPPAKGQEPFLVWAVRVPKKVWIGLFLSVPFPALGVGLCVLGLRQAKERGDGVRLAWSGIVTGSTILLLNLAYMAYVVLGRPTTPP